MKIEFTSHVEERIQQRYISRGELLQAISKGVMKEAKMVNGKQRYECEFNNVIAIIEKDGSTITIITCKYNRAYTKFAEKFAKRNKIGFYKALAFLAEQNIQVS